MPDQTASPEAADAHVNVGDTVTTSGFIGIGVPETVRKAVPRRFDGHGAPCPRTRAGQTRLRERGGSA